MARDIVTSENREEFMKKKMAKEPEDMVEIGIAFEDPKSKDAMAILKRFGASSAGASDKSSYFKVKKIDQKGLLEQLKAKGVRFDLYD